MTTETVTPISPPLESPLPREVLGHLYASMRKSQFLAGRLRVSEPVAPAILAGCLENAESDDIIISARRHPVLEVLRGAEFSAVMARPRAAKTKVDPAPALPKIAAVGDECAPAFAAGAAMMLRRASSTNIVIAFIPGKLSRGAAWEEATRFAGENRLPVIFVADFTLSRILHPHDGKHLSHWPCPTLAVDGRDVIAMYRVAKEAFSSARRGYGPALLDCINFLAPGRRGRDDRDPAVSFRGYLKRHNAWSDDWARELEAQIKTEFSRNKPAT